ncbi:MAG: helix-turn-helix domain-containing protein [Alphaproteobacteria bacterium]|jgi:cytoskeleton protein RodZ
MAKPVKKKGSLFGKPASGAPGDGEEVDISERPDGFDLVHEGKALVGELLRNRREANHLALSDVAGALRIRESYLDALERDDLDSLPGPAYAIGFLRSYAEFLGLNGEEAVRLFKKELEGAVPQSDLVFPEPVSESRIPRGGIILVSLVLAGTAYGLWYSLNIGGSGTANIVPEVPKTIAEKLKAEKPKAAKPEMEKSDIQNGAAEKAAAEKIAIDKAAAEKATVEKAAAEKAAAEKAAAEKAIPAPAVASVNPKAPAQIPAEVPAEVSSKIVVRAKTDSWIQIRNESGNLVMTRILRAGDSYAVPPTKGLQLMTGNAGALEILVDGTAVPPIGPFGAVRRGVSLDADNLRKGPAPAP